MKKLLSMVCAVMMAFPVAGMTTTTAVAQVQDSMGINEWRHGGRGWQGGRHYRAPRHYGRYHRGGPRYYSGRRYYRDGGGNAAAIIGGLAAGAIIGGALAQQPRAPRYYQGASNAHINWCANRYRSYDVRSNTFQPYNGPRRQCFSPYS